MTCRALSRPVKWCNDWRSHAAIAYRRSRGRCQERGWGPQLSTNGAQGHFQVADCSATSMRYPDDVPYGPELFASYRSVRSRVVCMGCNGGGSTLQLSLIALPVSSASSIKEEFV
jgi:hypothetical protein